MCMKKSMSALGVLRYASRSHARALDASLPHDDPVCITTEHFFCFHETRFDEMLCTLDSTKIPVRSNDTQPH